MNRRRFLTASIAAGAGLVLPGAPLRAQARLAYADMHTHFGVYKAEDLRAAMVGNGMLVIARKIVADRGATRREPGKGIHQIREPRNGELANRFDERLKHMRDEHRAHGLVEIADLATLQRVLDERVAAVVIAAEGGDFLDGDLKRLAAARREGLVHLQLVHYRVSELGDISTAMPVHDGLSAFGKDVVKACNRMGILVDLAHATPDGMAQALEISTKPMVYSHGHVMSGPPHWTQNQLRARGIGTTIARRIADKGGVVGIWPLATQYRSLDAYAGALISAAETLGATHVGVGSDMAGLPSGSVIPGYEEFPALEALLAKRGMKTEDISNILGANYLRVLREALTPA